MNWVDWSENIFDSIGLIAQEVVNQTAKDRIESATIEQVQGKNKYLVDNGSIKYTAYGASGTTYNEKDKVYVMILRGDYENQKLIMGDYSYQAMSTLESLSPSDSFVNMSGNLMQLKYIPEGKQEEKYVTFELIANGNNYFNPKSQNDFLKDPNYTTEGKDYDALFIGVSFKTNFDLTQSSGDNNSGAMVKGNYGLLVSGEEYDPDTNKSKNFYCFLDTKDMFGDYYNFDSYMKQEKKFAIDPTKIYRKIKVQLFQNILGVEKDKDGKDDFKEETNGFKRINLNNNDESNKYVDHIKSEENADIFARGMKIYFGYSLERYKTDTVLLWADESSEYGENEESNIKHLKTKFIYFQENGIPTVIEDVNDEKLNGKTMKVHWYKYDATLSEEESSGLAGKGWKESEKVLNSFTYTTKLKGYLENEKIKVIITIDGKKYSSEILTFENSDLIEKMNLIEGVNITYPSTDTNNGKFYFYSDVDKTASSGNYNKERTLEASLIEKNGDKTEWNDGDVLVWLIPSSNTMIRKPDEDDFTDADVFIEPNGKSNDSLGFEIKSRENYYVIAKKIKFDKDNVLQPETTKLTYKLKKNLANNKNRNTIVCYYHANGNPNRHSKDEVSFTFGTQGTNGSEYNLDIEWTEITQEDKKYNNPPAMTWKWDKENNKLKDDGQSTKKWIFSTIITNQAGEVVAKDSDKLSTTLNFYKSVSVDGDDFKADNFLKIKKDDETGILTLSINKVEDFPKKDNEINGDLVRILPYTLLKFKVTGKINNKKIELTKVIPLPFRSKRKYIGLRGPTEIIYGADGYNPKMNDDEAYEIIFKNKSEEDKVSEWQIRVYDKKDQSKEMSNYPQIINKKSEEDKDVINYYLKPANMYIPHEEENYTYSAVGIRAKGKDGSYLWAQPIYVSYDAYSTGFLNKWDGGMQIDEDENKILTSLIGAGTKKENKFSGIVLGDLRETVDGVIDVKTGILGIQEGKPTFSLGSDGIAKFGFYKDGSKTKGLIEIDGNNQTISGWRITENSFRNYDKEEKIGAVLKSSGKIGLALGCSLRDGGKDVNDIDVNTGTLQLWHSGKAKFGVSKTTGVIIEPNGVVKIGDADSTSLGPGLRLDGDGSIAGRHWGITKDGTFYLQPPLKRAAAEDSAFVRSNPTMETFEIGDVSSGKNFFSMGVRTEHPHVSGLNVGNSYLNEKRETVYPVGISKTGVHIAPENGEGKFLCTPDAEFSSHIKTLQGVYICSNYNNPVGSIEINGNGISLKGINYIQTSNDKIGESIKQIKFISNISKSGIKYYKHVRTMTFENGILVGITAEVQEEI